MHVDFEKERQSYEQTIERLQAALDQKTATDRTVNTLRTKLDKARSENRQKQRALNLERWRLKSARRQVARMQDRLGKYARGGKRVLEPMEAQP